MDSLSVASHNTTKVKILKEIPIWHPQLNCHTNEVKQLKYNPYQCNARKNTTKARVVGPQSPVQDVNLPQLE